MRSVEVYRKSKEIEDFLRKNLNLKSGSRSDQNLKDCYQIIVWYEEGRVRIPLSEFKKHFGRLLKYFEKIIDKEASPANWILVEQIKSRIPYMEDSEDILYLYEQVKEL